MDNVPIEWEGVGASPVGLTPFGVYDNDPEFVRLAPKVADWAARMLGYPTVSVELVDRQFYACFENAITEYIGLINQFKTKESALSMSKILQLAKTYGEVAQVGGDVERYQGSFNVVTGVQIYDLAPAFFNTAQPGKHFEITRVYHYEPPIFAWGGLSNNQAAYATNEVFGQEAMQFQAGMNFANMMIMMPVNEDLMRMQAIELGNQVRKSGYGFELVGTKIKILPIPTEDTTIYFDYKLTDEILQASQNISNLLVPDLSHNKTFDSTTIPFSRINEFGRSWIRRFTLANSKLVLGAIRAKFASIPIPNAEVNMDGETLRSEGNQEIEILRQELKDLFDATSRAALMEAQRAEADALQLTMSKSPLHIYIGAMIPFFICLGSILNNAM